VIAISPGRTLLPILGTVLLLGLAPPPTADAQLSERRVLTQDDYDLWRTIQGAAISRDGRWAAYTLTPAVGEGEVVVRSTSTMTEHRVPRGYTGRPERTPGVQNRAGFIAPAAQFTADSRHVVFTILPSESAIEGARRAGRRGGEQPRNSLGILRVDDGDLVTVPRVRNFRIPKEAGGWVAYQLEADTAAARRDTTEAPDTAATPVAAAEPGGAPRPVSTDTTRASGKAKETGYRLMLRNLATGAETSFEDVTGYEIDDTGRWLAFTVATKDGSRDGAYVHSLPDGRTHTLLAGEGNYKQIAFDEAGTQVAFVSDRDTFRDHAPRYALYHAALRSPGARAVVVPGAVRDGWLVSDRGSVGFTKNGAAITFGLAPAPLDSISADSLADLAVFDLWHYRDLRLQPQQRIDAARERNRSFTAVYVIGSRRVVPLGNDTFPNVTIADNGRVALAATPLPYAVEAMWGEGGSDLHVWDLNSGARTRIAERVRFGGQLSPGGNYVTFFDDGRWHAYHVASRRTVDLTGSLEGIRFDRETWSTPSTPAPWGIAGWTVDDRAVLIHDRYDVWEIDPSGRRAARNLTGGAGRAGGTVFRVLDLDRDERFIDPSRPLLLSVFDERTKAAGFAEARVGQSALPRTIVMADASFGTPQRARDAEMYLVTRSTFREFPDLHAGAGLASLGRISDANPQQAEYAWGDVELVRWRSADNVPLEGLLYRPEGFDPARRYPMVVYFYERHGDNLHSYVAPAGRNVVNPTVYTSLGYLVFFPDIEYSDGYPGPSALKSIVPGVHSLIARGFVDADGIGIAGQSWGGYQTAYIITQSNLFRAAVANAPVANMTSAYGGIRWSTGLARPFQYERTQSRIGGSLWEYPMRYLENSPLFHADRIQTPLLMMHNDSDGAVPWYQGIEMFIAMRRLQKEVYLINYNGDEHNPTKRANQKDIDMRMQQFFAHHLRGEPAPSWMTEGIPYLEKGRHQVTRPATAGAAEGADW
jgi:dipeptidyl aminopeptidase/acylaminoacyl peptidase